MNEYKRKAIDSFCRMKSKEEVRRYLTAIIWSRDLYKGLVAAGCVMVTLSFIGLKDREAMIEYIKEKKF